MSGVSAVIIAQFTDRHLQAPQYTGHVMPPDALCGVVYTQCAGFISYLHLPHRGSPGIRPGERLGERDEQSVYNRLSVRLGQYIHVEG